MSPNDKTSNKTRTGKQWATINNNKKLETRNRIKVKTRTGKQWATIELELASRMSQNKCRTGILSI